MITKRQRAEIIGKFQRNKKDSGSSEVQVALLSHEIESLTGHLQGHPKDNHSRRGLILKVGKRNKLLKYLAEDKQERYQEVIKTLGLRK